MLFFASVDSMNAATRDFRLEKIGLFSILNPSESHIDKRR